MSLHSTEAFVLRTYSLAEADKICIFLTKELGKVRGVAHGARKIKSRFGSALEPFTQVAAVIQNAAAVPGPVEQTGPRHHP